MRFKPLVDKLFYIFAAIIGIFIVLLTLLASFSIGAVVIMLAIDAFILYFLLSPLFGYVELRDETVFIKYGLMLKKEIPYGKIREINKGHGFYSESMMSLKNSLDHVNIKYNSFDVTTVSVKENDVFVIELNNRCLVLKNKPKGD